MSIRPVPSPVRIAQPEINRTLEQAVSSMAEAETMLDGDNLSACRKPMLEVHGALRILGIEGGAALAAECLSLLDALENADSLSREKAVDTLLYGLLLLPRYVDRVARQKRELPDVLLPTLNALRGLRRAPPLPHYHFTTFGGVAGGLDFFASARHPRASRTDLPGLIRRLRHMFQVGLLGLFRDPAAVVHARQVHRALSRLGAELGDTLTARWFRLGASLMALVVEGDLPVDHSLRMLLSRMDLHLRTIARDGAEVLDSEPPAEVSIGLLYYAVIGSEHGDTLRRLRESLGLGRMVTPPALIEHEREAMAAPSLEVMEAVSAALQEELERLKDDIETLSRLSSITESERLDICEQLGRLGSTLALIGVSDAAALLKREHTRLQSVVADGDPRRAQELLDQLADVLTEVEESVRGLQEPAPAGNREARKPRALRIAEEQAISEAIAGMARIRDALEFLNGDRDEGEAPEVADVALAEVVGTLHLIGHARVAGLLDRARRQITLLAATPDDTRGLASLADALASLEWYLEGLLERIDAGEEALELAEEALRALECETAAGTGDPESADPSPAGR